jgi:hypothetical protein
MQKIGIVAEGLINSDVVIISELIKKILSYDLSFCLRPGGSRGNVIKKFNGWLENLEGKMLGKL